MYYPGIPLLASASVFFLSQPSLIGPSVIVLSLLVAYSHSPTLQGIITPMDTVFNLLPNTGGDTPFLIVAFVILITSPPPSPLTIGNLHTSRKLLFLFVLAILLCGVQATHSFQDTEIVSKAAAILSMFWMRARARTEVEPTFYVPQAYPPADYISCI